LRSLAGNPDPLVLVAMNARLFQFSAARLFLSCVASAALLVTFNSSAKDLNPSAKDLRWQNGPAARPYVILLRHGQAPGRGEPANFDFNDCSTQRGLSDEGRDEARQLGHTLRTLGVNVTKVLTSRWCRARQTAELLGFGPIEDDRAFDNLDMNKNRSQFLLENERKSIASWRGPGVLVVVTHSSNLKALAKVTPESDSVIVVEPNIGANLTHIAQVNLHELTGGMLY
jgi:phosphohistidine phosphatase SixA